MPKTFSLAKRNFTKDVIDFVTHDHDLLVLIHAVAAAGDELSLLPEQVRSMSRYINTASLLGHGCLQMSELESVNAAAVKETVCWHNTDVTLPEDEMMVSMLDASGNILEGFYDTPFKIWRARFPIALKDKITHWAIIEGPNTLPSLNSKN